MKKNRTLLAVCSLVLQTKAGFAATTVFDRFPAEPSVERCKPLDYSSYFLAQNAKANIIELNPKLDRPNFNGKYLLLRNELLAETLYLIADCTTGAFFHEKLHASTKGKVSFNLTSSLVIQSEKEKDEYQIWKENEWIQVDDPNPVKTDIATAATTSAAVAPGSAVIKTDYDIEFARFPALNSTPSCKPLQFDSYFRAQQAKDSIVKDNPNLTQPNFAGKYLLLKTRLLFSTMYLIADCETGTFFSEPIKGEAHFKSNSRFVWVSESSQFPTTYVWDQSEWVELQNMHRTSPPPVHYTLTRSQSEALIAFVKRDRNDTIIRDDTLSCDSACEKAMPWLKLRGQYFTHVVCDTQKVRCELDAEVKPPT